MSLDLESARLRLSEEQRKHSCLDEAMEFLKKTVEKQREEINGMKSQLS